MEEKKGKYKYVLFGVACFQVMLCSGVLFGWSAISQTLLLDDKQGPGLDYDTIKEIYVFACMAAFCSCLPLGIIMDWFGPRICSISSTLLVATGFLICSLSNQANSDKLFTIGIFTLAFGGNGCQLSVIHLTNLFPDAKGVTTAIFTSCFNISFAVFVIFNKLWEATDLSYNEIFFGYSMTILLCVILGAVLFPDKPYGSKPAPFLSSAIHLPPKLRSQTLPQSYNSILPEDQEFSSRNRSETLDETLHVRLIRRPSSLNFKKMLQSKNFRRIPTAKLDFNGLSKEEFKLQVPNFDLKRASLTTQLRSNEFLRLLIFYLIGTLWTSFHCGFIGTMLGDQQYLSREQFTFALQSFVVLSLISGSITTPCFGMIADAYGYQVMMGLGLTCAVLYCLCFITKNIILLYIGFIIFPSYCSFQQVFLYAKLADDLGYRFFGVLSGFCSFAAGLVGLLQYFLIDFAAGSCHTEISPSCSEGNWTTLILIEILTFVGMILLLLPMMG